MHLYDNASPPLDDEALYALYEPTSKQTLRLCFVSSLDGAVAVDDKGSEPLSDQGDRRIFRLLRDLADAIVVGAGTLRAVDYNPITLNPQRRALRAHRGAEPYPTLVVVSASAALDPDMPALCKAPIRPVIVTCESAPLDRRKALADVADIVVVGEETVDLSSAIAVLRSRGMNHLLCEGGPGLAASLLTAELVDELSLTIAPQIVGAPLTFAGPEQLPLTTRMHLVHVLRENDTLYALYVRSQNVSA